MIESSEQPDITRFLLRHRRVIETSWFVSDELVVTFKPEISVQSFCQVMAALINDCGPTSATVIGDRTVRLTF